MSTWSLAGAATEPDRETNNEYSKLLRDRVGEAEEKAATERREKGIKLLGRRGVLQQHWNSRPGTREPRRGLSPRVAACPVRCGGFKAASSTGNLGLLRLWGSSGWR